MKLGLVHASTCCFLLLSSALLLHCSGGTTHGAATDGGAPADTGTPDDTDAASADAGFDPGTIKWALVESMHIARSAHTATLLPDGKVLVIGGEDGGRLMLDSIELFDPASGHWTEIGHLPTAVSNHTATLLANGKVLVVGGGKADNNGLPSGEGVTDAAVLVDPSASGAAVATATGSLLVARSHHVAALLPSGEVLVAGGAASADDGGKTGCLSDAEVFDPAKGTWRTVGALANARAMARATVVGDKVLVVGGFDSTSNMPRASELYDSATSKFADGGSLVGAGRIFLALTTLSSGDVLTVGGMSYDPKTNTSEFLDENERFTGGAWKQNGALATPRNAVSLVPLADGRALALGGYDYNPAYNGPLTGVEIFEPTQNAWFQLPTLKNARMSASATLLQDGRVLVCGGTGPLDTLGTCELGKAP